MAHVEIRNKHDKNYLHVDSSTARGVGNIINRNYDNGNIDTDCKLAVLDYLLDNSNITADSENARFLALYAINKTELIYTSRKHSDGLIDTISAFNTICSAVRGLQEITGDFGAIGDLIEIAVKLAFTPVDNWQTVSLRVAPIGQTDYTDCNGTTYEIGSNGKSFNEPVTKTDYIVYGIVPKDFELSAYSLLTLVTTTFKVYRPEEFLSVFGAVIDVKHGGIYGRVRYYSTTEKIAREYDGTTVGVWTNFINGR